MRFHLRFAVIAIFLFVSDSRIGWSHPGHGLSDHDASHYLADPYHAAPWLTVAAAAASGLAWYAWRRAIKRSGSC